MQKNADQIDDVQFPDQVKRNNVEVNLNYHFEPNHPMDGLTASFPYHGLSQVKQESFDWLVPGMIREKVLNVFKLLPKPSQKSTHATSQNDHRIFSDRPTQLKILIMSSHNLLGRKPSQR